jgi:nucleotide-binding universal stress UspA family protein
MEQAVFKHILVPTDGSRISEEAATAGIHLAKSLGARVTALYVIPEAPSSPLEAWAHRDRHFRSHLQKSFEKRGSEYLETIRDAARKAGVPCNCQLERGDSPHRQILATAEKLECDAIIMASHGKNGAASGLLGSETMKVATMGTIPVIVHHARPQ